MEIKCEEEIEVGNIAESKEIALSNSDRLIIGVVLGSVLFLLLVLITIIICKKRKQNGNLPISIRNISLLNKSDVLGMEDIKNIATNIQNHQWKQAPQTRPLPAVPKPGNYDLKE